MQAEELALHPSTKFKKLEELVYLYPDEVIKNPGVQKRLSLGTWKELHNKARFYRAYQAVCAAIEMANPKLLRRWVCDCAEEVMPVYEKHFRNPRLREALQVARDYIEEKATPEQLQKANHWAFDAAQEADEAARDIRPKEVYRDSFHKKYTPIEQAARVAIVVEIATSSEELFSRKHPYADKLISAPRHAAGVLAVLSYLRKQRATLVRNTKYSEFYNDRIVEVLEKQAMKLAVMLGQAGNTEIVLSKLSLCKREELNARYQKKLEDGRLNYDIEYLQLYGVLSDINNYEELRSHEILRAQEDPNILPEKLLELAWRYPLQVEANPLLSKVMLQNPKLGLAIHLVIHQQKNHFKVKMTLRFSPRIDVATWACLCAGRAFLEPTNDPEEILAAGLIKSALNCARKKQSNESLRAQMEPIKEILRKVEPDSFWDEWRAALKTSLLAAETAITGDVETAIQCAAEAINAAIDPHEECLWQHAAFREGITERHAARKLSA